MKRLVAFALLALLLQPTPASSLEGESVADRVREALAEALELTGYPADSFFVRDLRFWSKNEARLREIGAMRGEFPLPSATDPLRAKLIDRALRKPAEAVAIGLDLFEGRASSSECRAAVLDLGTATPGETDFFLQTGEIEGISEAPYLVRYLVQWMVSFDSTIRKRLPAGIDGKRLVRWMLDGIGSEEVAAAREAFDRLAEVSLRHILWGTVHMTSMFHRNTPHSGPWPEEERVRIHLPQGTVVIGTTGDDVYEEDAFLIVDPGGNDIYRNRAGGATGGAAMVMDLAGDDRYESQAPFSQGSALLGVGILVDYAGDDVYTGGDFCQGAAVGGIGALFDLGGKDSFTAGSFAQGAGALGDGLLWSGGDGADRYEIGRMGQGLGRVRGLGVLRDTGGDDEYVVREEHESMYSQWTGGRKVHWSFAQGCGFGFYCRYEEPRVGGKPGLTIREIIPGGVGILSDDAGNDRYTGSMYAQGTAYFYGLGILLDRGGDDHYRSTWYGQAAAPHFAAGILVDGAGNDTYHGMHQVQGNARDFSTAVFLEMAGNDTYFGEDRVQGCGDVNDCYGIFVDAAGDDAYEAKKARARGFATTTKPESQPTKDRPYADFGIFLDLAGKDEYTGPAGGADGKTWVQPTTRRGVGIDE